LNDIEIVLIGILNIIVYDLVVKLNQKMNVLLKKNEIKDEEKLYNLLKIDIIYIDIQ
jgi:hypothetical protein